MTGLDQFHSLKTILFTPSAQCPFPELEKMTYEELQVKEKQGEAWIEANKNDERLEKATMKLQWVRHFLRKTKPKTSEDMTMDEVESCFT